MSDTETKTIDPVIEPVKAEPVAEPEQTPKERIAEIAEALYRASPSGVEQLAGELAGLVEKL